MSPRRVAWIAAAVAWLVLPQPVVTEAANGVEALPEAEQMLFGIWTGQLADASRSAETKREAAEGLLTRNYPQAEAALKGFLADTSNLPARVAVAGAIAKLGLGKESYIEPLLAMLTGDQPDARTPAARALATYKGPEIAEKLVEIAHDRKRDRQVRLASLVALRRILEKNAVDGLVRLLDDPDPAVAAAAEDALVGLTNVRGMDREEWKRWWARNKGKNRQEWLASLTENIARAKKDLEADNERLRRKLASTMRQLYALTPPAQQDVMLLAMLKDPIADIRLVALDLVDRRISENGPVSADIRGQIRTMLDDPAPGVRSAVTGVIAHVGDAQALDPLLERLEVEPVSEVIQGLLDAVGQLRNAKAVPAVLARLPASDEAVATSAAMALARIASAQPLDADAMDKASRSLLTEYRRYAENRNSITVREALLTAMGTLAEARFVPVIKQALKDPQARVRRAAVVALASFGQADLAETIEPYAADPDHGVRQAAISALGSLNGKEHLAVILRRTDPETETQAAVRQQAWDVAMVILADADADVVSRALAELADRQDAPAMNTRIRQIHVEKLRQAGSDELPKAELELARALLSSRRAAEAASHLASAYKAYSQRKDPLAQTVWVEWVQALLAANDPGAIATIADQQDPDLLHKAVDLVLDRADALAAEQDWQALSDLAGAALARLGQRLDAQATEALRQHLGRARKQQLAADADRVAKLVKQAGSGDAATRQAAIGEIRTLGGRAVVPLLAMLQKNLSAENPSVQTEKLLVELLQQVAPKLDGYNPGMSRNERLALVESWLKQR